MLKSARKLVVALCGVEMKRREKSMGGDGKKYLSLNPLVVWGSGTSNRSMKQCGQIRLGD
jgi:hypothetical protein